MCRLSGKLLTAVEFYLKCVSCSIRLLGGFTLHHRDRQLPSQPLERIDRHPNLARFVGFYGRFTFCQNSLADFLLLGLKQSTKFQEGSLGILDETRQLVA